MKTMFVFVLLLLSLPAHAQLTRYSVTMTPADYQLLYTRDIFSDSLLPASLTVHDSLWNNSLVRFKGHSTRYYSKKSFRVRVPTAHLYHAQRDLNFNSMYTDKSFLRERLAWGLFADMNDMAPIAEHALFSLNGQPDGLYLAIDKFDKYFFQRRGRIVAPVYEADDTYDNADMTEQPDSILKLYYAKDVGSSTDYSDLSVLLHAINTAPDASFADTLDRYFDMPSILNWFTGNIVMMMGDSYSKNYAIYRDTSRATQQWTVIPWDYDISFGRSGDLAIPYPASLLNDRFAYTYPVLSGPSSVLKDRFMAAPGLMEELRLRVDTVLQTVFTEARMLPRIDSLAAYVSAAAENDPGKWGTAQDFHDHVDALKYFITARRNYLLKTFIHPPSGEYNSVTLPVTQTGVPYHFVAYDGRQLATLWFTSMFGLDSVLVVAHPDSMPPSLAAADGKYIRRWLEVVPFPSTAAFTARLQWSYVDVSTNVTEVGTGVQDERLLRSFVFDGAERRALPSVINPIANIATIDSVTEQECGAGKHFGLALSPTYTQKWFRMPLNNWQRWYDVTFSGTQNGWILGDHGSILKTTDGGTTWAEKAVGFNVIFTSLFHLSPASLWAVGQSGAVYESADSGETWTRHDLGVTSTFRAIAFVGPVVGYLAGDGDILRTTDGGGTWSTIVADSTQSFQCLTARGYDILSVGSSRGLSIYSSPDGGLSWSTTGVELTGSINAVAPSDSSALWAAGDSGKVFYRASTASPWQSVATPGSATIRRLFARDGSHIYGAGDGGAIWYSTDAGTHWYSQYGADTHDLFGLTFTDSTHGFAVGSGGSVLTTTASGTVTGVAPPVQDLPITYQLSQNYPNPFNPETRIEFSIVEGGAVRLTVYDILGREVAVLVNEPMPPGRYRVNWNAGTLPTGVYFYRLHSGAFVETKKLLLLR